MANTSIKLDDKYNLAESNVLLNGTQALVRLMLGQKYRDYQSGLNTAGFVTGYRGSPVGAVDFQMKRAAKELEASKIQFKEALNEDLATTALWGAQQAELRGEGLHDGVFGLWYGKGPGVDRSGDAMRHANMAGTSRETVSRAMRLLTEEKYIERNGKELKILNYKSFIKEFDS